MHKRAVITGIGIRSPLGNTPEEFFRNALKGASRVAPITKFDASPFASRIAGQICEAEPPSVLHAGRRIPNAARWGLEAAREAMRDAGLSAVEGLPIDVIVGVSISALEYVDAGLFSDGKASLARIQPHELVTLNPAYAAALISQELGLNGEIINITTACSSSTSAIGYALRLIQMGESSCVLTGGADEGVSPLFLGAFANGSCLSTRNDDPQHASRPFERNRDGNVQADAACILVLEEYERACARGAEVYAEITGFGSAGDSCCALKFPKSEWPGAQAIKKALYQAGREASEVSYYSALGVAHPWIDVLETKTIKLAFQDAARRLLVSSVRSMMGHPMGASGGIQTVVAAQAIRHRAVPPTINYDDPDPACDLDYVPNEARSACVKDALVYTFGNGGNHSALVLSAC
ncbi:MAG: beta-ketoacyl-[acyl-carrier-protein] synthase family protein [Planctomycetota bacterium]|nr:beta-ketoacyl-[acyl-carrier-protein] synthase family protein [Planctomycetota bacterium]